LFFFVFFCFVFLFFPQSVRFFRLVNILKRSSDGSHLAIGS